MIHGSPLDEKTVLKNWLDSLPEGKRKKFLKVVGDEEIYKWSGSEDEYRAITGKQIPDRFPLVKPLSPDEIMTPDVTEQMLNERMEQIEKAFPGPVSMEELREMAEGDDHDSDLSMEDLKKKAQPSLKISISIEQMKQMANKA